MPRIGEAFWGILFSSTGWCFSLGFQEHWLQLFTQWRKEPFDQGKLSHYTQLVLSFCRERELMPDLSLTFYSDFFFLHSQAVIFCLMVSLWYSEESDTSSFGVIWCHRQKHRKSYEVTLRSKWFAERMRLSPRAFFLGPELFSGFEEGGRGELFFCSVLFCFPTDIIRQTDHGSGNVSNRLQNHCQKL